MSGNREPGVVARLRAAGQAWRADWEDTWRSTRVVLIVVAALFVLWAAFAIWFVIGFRS